MTRFIDCTCALEGTPGKRWHETGINRFDGSLTGYSTPCGACEGAGVIEIEDEPVELEDLADD